MNRINSVLAFIGRHKYFFVIVFFLLLIVVLDDNCILIRMERRERMAQMKATIAQYQKEYEQDSKALNELNDHHQLEKLARERYHMKRDGEDLVNGSTVMKPGQNRQEHGPTIWQGLLICCNRVIMWPMFSGIMVRIPMSLLLNLLDLNGVEIGIVVLGMECITK